MFSVGAVILIVCLCFGRKNWTSMQWLFNEWIFPIQNHHFTRRAYLYLKQIQFCLSYFHPLRLLCRWSSSNCISWPVWVSQVPPGHMSPSVVHMCTVTSATIHMLYTPVTGGHQTLSPLTVCHDAWCWHNKNKYLHSLTMHLSFMLLTVFSKLPAILESIISYTSTCMVIKL